MRLGFIYESAYPWFNGGIEKRRYLIGKELVNNGIELHFFIMYREGLPGKEFTEDGIKYHVLGSSDLHKYMYKKNGKRSILFPIIFSFLLFNELFKYKLDMIDTDSFPFIHLIPIFLYTKIRHIPLIITWHEVWDFKYWLSYRKSIGIFGYLAELLVTKMGNAIITNSIETKKRLISIFKVRKEIYVKPCAISKKELDRFNTLHVKKENRLILISRLVEHKRVDKAIEIIKDSKLNLLIVGDGPLKDKLNKMIKDYKLEGRVKIVSNISEKELISNIITSLALFLTSEREGLSLVVIESLSLGIPVVILDSTNIPNELRRYCIEISNSNDLDSIDYSALAMHYKKIRDKIIERYKVEGIEKLYLKIYKEFSK